MNTMTAANIAKQFLSIIGIHHQILNAVGPKYISLDI
jgi:hypothetical protein